MIKQSALWLNLVRNQCTALNFLVDIIMSKACSERIPKVSEAIFS